MAAAVFGVTYLMRVVAYSGTTLRWLRWASPLGWVGEMRPLTGSRPLLLIPIAVTVAALSGRGPERRDPGHAVHGSRAAREFKAAQG